MTLSYKHIVFMCTKLQHLIICIIPKIFLERRHSAPPHPFLPWRGTVCSHTPPSSATSTVYASFLMPSAWEFSDELRHLIRLIPTFNTGSWSDRWLKAAEGWKAGLTDYAPGCLHALWNRVVCGFVCITSFLSVFSRSYYCEVIILIGSHGYMRT